MTKHDEVRQILHDTGFKFSDDRTALDMTDEEVELFLVNFLAVVADFGRKVTVMMEQTLTAFSQAIVPLHKDMELILGPQTRKRNPL